MRYLAILLIIAYGSLLSLRAFVWAACLYLWNNTFQPMVFAYRIGQLPVASYVFLVLLFSYLHKFLNKSFRPRINFMVCMGGAFLGWLFICSIMSSFQDVVWISYFEILKYIAPIMLISTGLCCYKDILLVSATLMLSVGVWSAQAGVKGLASGVTTNMGIPFSQMSDNNDFMAAAVGILPMLIYFWLNYRGKFQTLTKLFIFMMFILTLCAIVFSNSRGAVIGVIGAIVFYIIVVSKKKIRDLFMLLFFILFTSFLLPQSFWERIETIDFSIKQQSESSASTRLNLMKSAFRCAREHPLFGVGPDSWIYVSEQYAETDSEPHSAYIKVAAESGFVGASIFIALLVMTIKRLLSNRKRLMIDGNLALAKLSLALAMVLVCIAIPFTFLNQPYSEFLWAWLGVANAFLLLISTEKNYVRLFPFDINEPNVNKEVL